MGKKWFRFFTLKNMKKTEITFSAIQYLSSNITKSSTPFIVYSTKLADNVDFLIEFFVPIKTVVQSKLSSILFAYNVYNFISVCILYFVIVFAPNLMRHSNIFFLNRCTKKKDTSILRRHQLRFRNDPHHPETLVC